MVGAVLHGRMPVAPAWPLRAGEPGDIDPARTISARYGTPHILLGDLDPARLTASGLSPSYLESTGLTAASTSGQTLGLLLERSGGAALGPELVTNGTFDSNVDGWTGSGGTPLLSWSAGKLRIENGAALASHARQTIASVAGRTYRITLNRVGGTGTGLWSISGAGLSSTSGYYVATSSSFIMQLYVGGATSGHYYEWDNVSVREVAGNHLYQSTSADEPTLVQENGIWRLRGDGLTKNFLTPLVPAASMTMMVACEFNAVSDAVIGANDASNANRMRLLTDAAGLLAGAVGAHDVGTIKGGSDIRDIPGVAAIRVNGTTVSLGWKALSGAFSWVYQAAQSGVPTTTTPLRVGAYNNNGTNTSPLDGDIFRVLAQQSAYTDAEISTIASQWSRELGGTG